MSWRGSSATVGDRILASLPYLIPLSHGLAFAMQGALVHQFLNPQLLIFLLTPFLLVHGSFFISLMIFLALFFLVVRNSNILHLIRFNTMQALIVDIALSIAGIILPYFSRLSGLDFLATVLADTAFLGAVAVSVFAIVQTLRGLYAEIPTLSEAAYAQVNY